MKNTKIVNTCGSGMTASVLNFAEELIGVKNKAIYDGSWTEFVLNFFDWIFILFILFLGLFAALRRFIICLKNFKISIN